MILERAKSTSSKFRTSLRPFSSAVVISKVSIDLGIEAKFNPFFQNMLLIVGCLFTAEIDYPTLLSVRKIKKFLSEKLKNTQHCF